MLQLPEGVSERIGEVLEVLTFILQACPAAPEQVRAARREALIAVARARELRSKTVYHKCKTGLALASIGDFDDLVWRWLAEGDRTLQERLQACVPSRSRELDLDALQRFFGDKTLAPSPDVNALVSPPPSRPMRQSLSPLVQETPAADYHPAVEDDYQPPPFDAIVRAVQAVAFRISERDLLRYHLALQTRGFVILSGVSGVGKTWLTAVYARAVGAEYLLVPVAPNWTTNEDLLGYLNPVDGCYHDTPFSHFLRAAARACQRARAAGQTPRPYHLVLDEMNLARVEYYFATFLSAMEARAHQGEGRIHLAPGDEVVLPANLYFIGTVNVDEASHSFADRVCDRAQLIELQVNRESLREHLGEAPYGQAVLAVWDAVHPVAPFAFRVLDEIKAYVQAGQQVGMGWEEALDQQLLQKILPKMKGADPEVGQALERFLELVADRCPLSAAKARRMLEGFRRHGFASYF